MYTKFLIRTIWFTIVLLYGSNCYSQEKVSLNWIYEPVLTKKEQTHYLGLPFGQSMDSLKIFSLDNELIKVKFILPGEEDDHLEKIILFKNFYRGHFPTQQITYKGNLDQFFQVVNLNENNLPIQISIFQPGEVATYIFLDEEGLPIDKSRIDYPKKNGSEQDYINEVLKKIEIPSNYNIHQSEILLMINLSDTGEILHSEILNPNKERKKAEVSWQKAITNFKPGFSPLLIDGIPYKSTIIAPLRLRKS